MQFFLDQNEKIQQFRMDLGIVGSVPNGSAIRAATRSLDLGTAGDPAGAASHSTFPASAGASDPGFFRQFFLGKTHGRTWESGGSTRVGNNVGKPFKKSVT